LSEELSLFVTIRVYLERNLEKVKARQLSSRAGRVRRAGAPLPASR